jgi:Bacterial Ig-like domain (group 2)/PKD domain
MMKSPLAKGMPDRKVKQRSKVMSKTNPKASQHTSLTLACSDRAHTLEPTRDSRKKGGNFMQNARLSVFMLVAGLTLLFTACNDITPPPDPVPTVTAVAINGKPISFKVGDTLMLSALVTGQHNPSQTVSWSSENSAVASINSSGELRGLKAGNSVITATSTLDPKMKDTFNLAVDPNSPGELKISSNPGTQTHAGGSPIILLAVKPSASDTVSWSISGVGSLSPLTGDSTTYTPPATGTGTATITASTGTQTATLDITVTAPQGNPDAGRVAGVIENWTEPKTIFFASSSLGETLGQDEVGGDGKLDITLNRPNNLEDLDRSVSSELCDGGANSLRSEPATLEGAILYNLQSDSGLIAAQRSFPFNGTLLDGVTFVFRAYSSASGTVTGSCRDYYTGADLDFDATLAAGWNLVQAVYRPGNNAFEVTTISELPSDVTLKYATSFVTPVNEPPVAYLTADVGPNYLEVIISAAGYDADGYIASYTLDMGDGTVYTEADFGDISSAYFSYYYAYEGYYPVTLTVCDDSGDCSYAYAEAHAY